MSVRVTAAAQFVTDEGITVTTAARVLGVSRQAIYDRLAPAVEPDHVVVTVEPGLRLVPPVLPEGLKTIALGPQHCDVETAIHVLALRYPAAGYRTITARARRAGHVLNRKKTARLLKAWVLLRSRKKPHPKAQGKPFDITPSKHLWQADMTSIWCGEDGWGYFTAVIDCFDRVLLGWSFTLRCRAVDFTPPLAMVWSTAFL